MLSPVPSILRGCLGRIYDAVIATVWGVVRRVVRDRAQSEEEVVYALGWVPGTRLEIRC